MKIFFRLSIVGVIFLSGCAGFNAHNAASTPIQYAQQEIPEALLLEVGVAVFTSKQQTAEEAKKEGTLPGIRKAENHFVPFHL